MSFNDNTKHRLNEVSSLRIIVVAQRMDGTNEKVVDLPLNLSLKWDGTLFVRLLGKDYNFHSAREIIKQPTGGESSPTDRTSTAAATVDSSLVSIKSQFPAFKETSTLDRLPAGGFL